MSFCWSRGTGATLLSGWRCSSRAGKRLTDGRSESSRDRTLSRRSCRCQWATSVPTELAVLERLLVPYRPLGRQRINFARISLLFGISRCIYAAPAPEIAQSQSRQPQGLPGSHCCIIRCPSPRYSSIEPRCRRASSSARAQGGWVGTTRSRRRLWLLRSVL